MTLVFLTMVPIHYFDVEPFLSSFSFQNIMNTSEIKWKKTPPPYICLSVEVICRIHEQKPYQSVPGKHEKHFLLRISQWKACVLTLRNSLYFNWQREGSFSGTHESTSPERHVGAINGASPTTVPIIPSWRLPARRDQRGPPRSERRKGDPFRFEAIRARQTGTRKDWSWCPWK